ncbi:MAG: two-component hybrid sensor and regulator [uncultured bacterium]|nr:MAG: two-component hybrid sensor and regulator [uncultured bacterium]
MNYNEVSTLRELTSVIDLKEKEFPHIIIVDLPHIDDDKKVIFQLKKNEKLKDTKFVVISQDASIGDAKKYSQLGFEAFLPKPLKQEELLKVISTILGDSRKSGEIVTRHLANEISCKGINVLVAEDNPINQKLIMAILNKMGCTFDVAPNGHEAIEKIKKKNYDVCLMDIMMPVMGGIEATRIIRSELKLSVPIIALSAATMESDVKESLISGMDDFLSKPIDANKLQQKLFKWGKSL